MRTILLALFVLTINSLHAQRECYSSHRPQSAAASSIYNFTEVISGIRGINQSTVPAGVIRIPVVVHVLYQTDAQNISDAQIKSGIAALNRDFRRKNKDTVNTPARFKHLAADVEIEFELASSDPRGVATNGIVRKRTSTKEWTLDDKIKSTKTGGDDPWDPDQYLNIWIGNMPRVLGYSSMPGDAKAVDGVAIHYNVFGTIGRSGAYNMGRTLVHETGHWLGLKHIWGDTYCGDDGIDDTPKQGSFTSGCPSYFLSSCDNGTLGDMYMNYMDFTNDACMNLFTLGQKEKMRSLFAVGGPRRSLLNSIGLKEPTVEEAPIVSTPVNDETVVTTPVQNNPTPQPAAAKANIYPNPASSFIQISLPDASWLGTELTIVGMNGAVVKKIVVNGLQQKITVSELPTGMYFIQGFSKGNRLAERFIKTASGQ